MDPDGSNPVRLIEGLQQGQSLAWSPDGGQLAFTENYGALVIIDVDGCNTLALTKPRVFSSSNHSWSGELVFDPAWSPDGTTIAFAADPDFEGLDVYVMNTDGSGRSRLTHDRRSRQPAWSADGTRIAFSALGEDEDRIDVIGADGSGRQALAGKKGMRYGDPSWSPDGTRIAFASAPHDDWGWISLVQSDGTERRSLTQCQIKPLPLEPAWSHDGGKIAFNDGAGISVVDHDGSNRTRLTGVAGDRAPAWSPDGKRIAFFRH